MAGKKGTVVLPRTIRPKRVSSTEASRFDRGTQIPKTQTATIQDVKTLRATTNVVEALRLLARVDGTFSAAVFAYVQIADSGYKVQAFKTGTHEYDEAGTLTAESVLASMDTLYDYSKGYGDKQSIPSLVTTLLREAALTGACAIELVMNKFRLPDRVSPIKYESIRWKSDGEGGRVPEQLSAKGGFIDLNIPNVWVSEMHKEAATGYAHSMFEAALPEVFYYLEFIEDMRRTVRKSGHNRLTVMLDTQKVKASAPASIAADEAKLKTFLEGVRGDVEQVLSGLEPEDAIVAYDTMILDQLAASGEKADYKDLMGALAGLLATALKTHPSILGLRLSGSQSLTNTESLVFLKNVAAIQKVVAEALSRAMTLATRLSGSDVYVKFEFESVELRPKAELEAFMTMRQDRILEQLSLGFISDEEAARLMGTGTRPPGAPPLSGTMFHGGKTQTNAPTPNSDPMGQSLQPSTPSKAGGASN